MYAVFRTGGKQFRAEPGKKIRVPTMGVEAGEAVTFDDILLASDGKDVQVGAPMVKGAKVVAEVVVMAVTGRSLFSSGRREKATAGSRVTVRDTL